MEHFAFDKLLPFLRYRKIRTIVTDGDLKLWKDVRKVGIDQLVHVLDPNHAVKSFIRKITSLRPKCKIQLDSVGESLVKFFNILIKDKDLTCEEKKLHWLNSKNHFFGDHILCLHGKYLKPSRIDVGGIETLEALAIFLGILNTILIL
jgi:hypothetical protein